MRSGVLLGCRRHRHFPGPRARRRHRVLGAARGVRRRAVAFTAAVWGLARRRGTAYDSLTALVLVGCLAAGVILASDVYHSGSNVEQLLFGSLPARHRSGHPARPRRRCGDPDREPRPGAALARDGIDEVEGPVSTGGWLEIVLLALIALATTAALSVIGALLVAAIFVGAGRHRPALRRQDGLLADRQRPPRRGRGNRWTVALGEDQRTAGGDHRHAQWGSVRHRSRRQGHRPAQGRVGAGRCRNGGAARCRLRQLGLGLGTR